MAVTRSSWEPAQKIIFIPQIVGAGIVYGAPPPPITSVTIVAGGSIAVGVTPAYRVTVLDSNLNESLPGLEVVGAATTTGNQTANVTFLRIPGAYAYRVYGRTAGGELYIAMVSDPGSGTSVTYADTGAITPAGAMPTSSPGRFSGRLETIVYGIIASTTQSTAATVKIYSGSVQIGVLIATPTLGTVQWPGTPPGVRIADLWISTSAAIDVSVLTN